jgi:ketosteroid isomerase-like protein
MTSDEQAVLDLHLGFVAANRTGDTSFLRAHMAPGKELVWFNLNRSTYLGVDHICRLWEYLSESALRSKGGGGRATCESIDPQVTVVGDVAWVTYRLRFEADFGPELGQVNQPSRGTEIWRRIDGEWRMAHCHFSDYAAGGWEGGL